MKYLIAVILIAIGIFYFKNKTVKQSPAVETYKSFVKAIFKNDFNEAKSFKLSEEALAELGKKQVQVEYYDRNGERGTITQMDFQVKSESYSDGNTKAHLVIFQQAHCGKRQIASSMSSNVINYNHSADLVKNGPDWTIQSFQFSMGEPKPGGGNNLAGLE